MKTKAIYLSKVTDYVIYVYQYITIDASFYVHFIYYILHSLAHTHFIEKETKFKNFRSSF